MGAYHSDKHPLFFTFTSYIGFSRFFTLHSSLFTLHAMHEAVPIAVSAAVRMDITT